MSVSYVRPSMGAIRRPVSRDVAAAINCCTRSFHAAARRLDEQAGSGSAAPPIEPPSRRIRNANAGQAISSLQQQRAPPRTPRTTPSGSSIPNGKLLTPRKPLISRLPLNRSAQGDANTKQPPGTMARAPSKLRISRMVVGSPTGGPGGGPGGRRPGPSSPRGTRPGDKPRGRKPKADDAAKNTRSQVPRPEDHLSDGMLAHLARLQKKEWEKKPYEPKYAPGSLAANELIHLGRELFRGESPDVKVWGRLEERIGVVGMHGAEAALEVRRVVDHNDTMLDEYDLPDDVVSDKKDAATKKDDSAVKKSNVATNKDVKAAKKDAGATKKKNVA
ncbi:hypothetical protein DM02DRAFT_690672 [Periconia macrospinosa]|uniref:Uncharacterized protein n=1 Tax=Periconia macrospinosa TaxID=97972 RepID=A0A2V1ECB9_9PLEO|nr:hypothetical protein DM02DRAFT_690672 [Periconia macrospinosa]